MLQFCRNKLKIEQNLRALSLMLVQNYMQNLHKMLVSKFDNHEILVLLPCNILAPDTRRLALMILQLKPKVVNVLAKTWFIKTSV